jgi:hypothetical protein
MHYREKQIQDESTNPSDIKFDHTKYNMDEKMRKYPFYCKKCYAFTSFATEGIFIYFGGSDKMWNIRYCY